MPSSIPSVNNILGRLDRIFPEGIENRNYIVREMSAKTIYVMIYCMAIEGTDRWIRPSQVTNMSDSQAEKIDYSDRESWYLLSLKSGKMKNNNNTWYADNTREPIRDETLRYGLIEKNAVIENMTLPTTSPKPRYALQREFYHLLICDEDIADEKIDDWKNKYLSHEALARTILLNQAQSSKKDNKSIFIDLPDGQRRKMLPGESSILTKFVIEKFATRFLKNPAVVFISESGNKIVFKDDQVTRSIGLIIPVDKSLPDLIIADLDTSGTTIYFVEIVATDGPINTKRKEDLLKIASASSFNERNIQFLTVFKDRNCSPFKKNISSIASNTLIWFASEPKHIMIWNTLCKNKLNDFLSVLGE